MEIFVWRFLEEQFSFAFQHPVLFMVYLLQCEIDAVGRVSRMLFCHICMLSGRAFKKNISCLLG